MKQKTKFKQTEIGMIPEDWESKELKDILEKKGYIRGPFGSSLLRRELKKEGIPVYEQQNAIYDHRIFRFYIDEEKHEELRRFTVEENDLIISCSGTFGKISIIQKDDTKGIISQALLILRPDTKKVNPHFLKYFFISDKGFQTIASRSLGSVQVNIAKREVIEKIELAIPKSRNEQNVIVKILLDLDSKIELNQQMNKTLEAIGQAIFKHWFVDFEFPNEEGKPYKSSDGKMIYDEELEKKVPKGWKVKQFSQIIEVNPKRELSKGNPAKKIGMADLNPWQSWIENWSLEEYKSGPKFKNGDTLFARITPSLENGKTAFVSMLDNNEVGFGSTEFIVFSKKVISSRFYIFHLCRSEEIRGTAISAMTGTSGRQRVPDDLFDYLHIILPPVALLDEFEKISSSMFNRIFNNAKEINLLSQLRDSLLPKLMSGKIRVPVEAR